MRRLLLAILLFLLPGPVWAVHPTPGTPVESNAITADTTPFTVSRAAGTNGNVTIAIICTGANPTLTWPGDYTVFATLTANSNGIHGEIAYHMEDGSEGTTFNITSSASDKWAAIVYSVSGSGGDAHVPESAVSNNQTATQNPNPPALTPTGGSRDYLWLAGFCQEGEEADDDTWVSGIPAGYLPGTTGYMKTSSTAGQATTNTSLGVANRQLTASSEDPGTFTVAQSLAYASFTVAVHPYIAPAVTGSGGMMGFWP